MSELLTYDAPGAVDYGRLEHHIASIGLRVRVLPGLADTQFVVNYDGTAAGREQVREIIQEGLRAQNEPAEVVFHEERTGK